MICFSAISSGFKFYNKSKIHQEDECSNISYFDLGNCYIEFEQRREQEINVKYSLNE